MTCATLLHDAVEDHTRDIADGGRAAALAAAGQSGEREASLVEDATNPGYAPGGDRNRQDRDHIAASLAASPRGRVVKASDFTDDGVGLIHTSGPKAVKLACKYAPLVPVLTSLIAPPGAPLAPPVRAQIISQFVTAQERFAVIAQAGAAT